MTVEINLDESPTFIRLKLETTPDSMWGSEPLPEGFEYEKAVDDYLNMLLKNLREKYPDAEIEIESSDFSRTDTDGFNIEHWIDDCINQTWEDWLDKWDPGRADSTLYIVDKETGEIIGSVVTNQSLSFDDAMKLAGFEFLAYPQVEADGWSNNDGFTIWNEETAELMLAEK